MTLTRIGIVLGDRNDFRSIAPTPQSDESQFRAARQISPIRFV
jgi:hypothetical protein